MFPNVGLGAGGYILKAIGVIIGYDFSTPSPFPLRFEYIQKAKGPKVQKVSVVIPVYNVERYIEQCLTNLIYQTYKNLEIIIVDDGSPDSSNLIYKKYAANDGRIKIIKQKNQGLSCARNIGLKHATGDYVHFMDADDYIDLDYYEKIIEGNKDINADIIAAGVISQNTQNYSVKYDTKCLLKTLTEKFINTNALSNCTVWRYVFKRDFLIRHNLSFIDGRIFEDMLFTPEAIRLSNYILTIPNTFYHYVYNDNSLLHKQYTPRHQEQYKYAAEQLQNFIDKYNLSENIEIPNTTKTTFKLFGLRVLNKKENQRKHIITYTLFNIPIIKKYHRE